MYYIYIRCRIYIYIYISVVESRQSCSCSAFAALFVFLTCDALLKDADSLFLFGMFRSKWVSNLQLDEPHHAWSKFRDFTLRNQWGV